MATFTTFYVLNLWYILETYNNIKTTLYFAKQHSFQF